MSEGGPAAVVDVVEVATPRGPGRLHLHRHPHPHLHPRPDPDPAERARRRPRTRREDTSSPALLLAHGAGGGVDARDLQALSAAARDGGWLVGRLEQPHVVAGRRPPAPAAHLDDAFRRAADVLREHVGAAGPLVVGGRSTGARVACRTATAVGAVAVLGLALPLHPPGRPERSRAHEAEAVLDAGLPVAVAQGARDRFGTAADVRDALPRVHVVEVSGAGHDLRGLDEEHLRRLLDHVDPHR